MSLNLKRNFWLIIVFIAVIVACWALGSTRIIAYNFGNGRDIKVKSKNYDNSVDLFDDSVVHEITIGLSQEDYDRMVKTYQETGEKDYVRTYVVIDGVTIPDVGVRLKGNLSLRQTLGGGMGNNPGGMPLQRVNNNDNNIGQPPEMARPRNIEFLANLDFPDNWESLTKEEQDAFMQAHLGERPTSTRKSTSTGEERKNMIMPGVVPSMAGGGGNPPYLLKFDEFVPGQTYENFAEVAIRIGSDASLLAEPTAYAIHKYFGQVVPETAYAVVAAAQNKPSLYVICEHLDEQYVKKYFPQTDGILYKAGNFVGFEYKGDDPSLYLGIFEQKTKVNRDDLAPLIRFLKFVASSTDEEFASQLPQWLDIDSFTTMMALDDLLANNDSFSGMGSNYYLFYDKTNEKFRFLSWDMNLAMGGMGRRRQPNDNEPELNAEEERQRQILEEWLKEGGFNEADDTEVRANMPPGGGFNRGSSRNILKDRFMANEAFAQMYNEKYEVLKQEIFGQEWIVDKINQLASTFTSYNSRHQIVDQTAYNSGVEKIKNFVGTINSQ